MCNTENIGTGYQVLLESLQFLLFGNDDLFCGCSSCRPCRIQAVILFLQNIAYCILSKCWCPLHMLPCFKYSPFSCQVNKEEDCTCSVLQSCCLSLTRALAFWACCGQPIPQHLYCYCWHCWLSAPTVLLSLALMFLLVLSYMFSC